MAPFRNRQTNILQPDNCIYLDYTPTKTQEVKTAANLHSLTERNMG